MAQPRRRKENIVDEVKASWTTPPRDTMWGRSSWKARFDMRSGRSVEFGVDACDHGEALKRGLQLLYGAPNFMSVLDNWPGPGY